MTKNVNKLSILSKFRLDRNKSQNHYVSLTEIHFILANGAGTFILNYNLLNAWEIS